ncbi:MAG: F0F1 ATP synthase subunit A [Anaerolineales bacterium]|jgi:F-type H+-transporting ATPase subunit a
MEGFLPTVAFTVFGVPIRDTVVATWALMAILLVLAVVINRRKPTALEMLVDFINDLVSGIIGRPAVPYLALLGSLAIFIAAANVVGVVPFLVSPTRDINTPLALALVVFFSVHYFGIRTKGLFRYLKEMASPIFLLPLEIISQISRTISLTLRLFGNIFSAELILAIVFLLVPLFVPLPLAGLGIFTGLLQAYIFTALAAVYIGAGIEAVETGRKKEKG